MIEVLITKDAEARVPVCEEQVADDDRRDNGAAGKRIQEALKK